MKVRINNKPNAKQKKVLKEECRKEFYKLLEHYNKQVALQVMNILHFDYGFGEKRLRQFFFKLKEMPARYIERYEVEDDDVPDICEIQLREAGINFEDFFEMDDE
jgi:hypothetical protein